MFNENTAKGNLYDAISELTVHDHICIVYETKEEQLNAVVPFIKLGLDRGEKCIYVVDDNTSKVVIEAMQKEGIETESVIKSGALNILTKQEAYLQQGHFDPDWMIQFLKEATDLAKSDGFNALRVTGEMTWYLGGDIRLEKLTEYEAKLNYFFQENDALAICQYNSNRFSSEILLNIIQTHPIVIYGDLVCKNAYYIPPEEFLKPAQIDLKVKRMLKNITEYKQVELKHKESEERNRLLVRSINDYAIFMLTPEGIVNSWNEGVRRIKGYSSDEIIGKHFSVFYPEEDIKKGKIEYELQKAREDGRCEDEGWRIRKDGSRFLAKVIITALYDDSGKLHGYAKVTSDITERKKAEETLKESEKKFRNLVESAPDSILIVDEDNRIILANGQTERVYGYTKEELIGQSHDILLPEHFRQSHAEHRNHYISKPLTREMGASLDLACLHKDGREIPVEVSLSPLRTEKGIQVIVVTRDITERKEAEGALREKVQELTALNRLSQQVSSSLSLDQVVSAALDEVTTALAPDLTLFFLREGDNLILQGMRAESSRYRHDETPVHRVGECLCGLSVSKGIPMYSSDILNDPRCTWEECKKADLRSFAALPLFGNNEIIGVLGLASGTHRDFEKQSIFLQTFTNDISTGLQNAILYSQVQKHAEELEASVTERTEELTRANTRLKELDHLKSMFIASMSHELRTPLNSIMGFTGIILQGMVGEVSNEQRKQLSMVKASATHLLSLINDIIDISKIEAGKVEIYIHKFELLSVVKDVINSFDILAKDKNLKMDLRMPKKIVVESDERRVKQILVNFVSNAIKFTEKGSVHVCVLQNSDSAIEISVTDTGIGIKEEDMDKLFKAFSRIPIDGVIKEGTGLGLYLSRKISELLGCEIRVESEFGKGSVFTLTLPLRCT